MTDQPNPAAAVAAALATLVDAVTPMQEATIGYRAQLIEMGMGKEAADQCAADFHSFLIAQLPRPNYGQGAKR